MTYEKFSEIWDEHITKKGIRFDPGSPKLRKALIALSNGDSSYFDEIQKYLPEYKVNK